MAKENKLEKLYDTLRDSLYLLANEGRDAKILSHLVVAMLEKELYRLWVVWTGDQNVKWSADNNKSFVLWLLEKE